MLLIRKRSTLEGNIEMDLTEIDYSYIVRIWTSFLGDFFGDGDELSISATKVISKTDCNAP
jgi:hypothetical protein